MVGLGSVVTLEDRRLHMVENVLRCILHAADLVDMTSVVLAGATRTVALGKVTTQHNSTAAMWR